MKVLVICINVVFGHCFIEIDANQILMYYIMEDGTILEELKIIDTRDNFWYKLNTGGDIVTSGKVTPSKGINANINPNVDIIASKIIDSNYMYLDFSCIQQKITMNMVNPLGQKTKFKVPDSLNISQSAEVSVIEAMTKIKIIDQYIPDKDLRHMLFHIGGVEKYNVESHSVVSNYEPSLNHQLLSIDEKDSINPKIKEIVKVFKRKLSEN